MFSRRTPEGKVVIHHIETGQRLERWPVDARELLHTGEYTTDDPAGDQASVPAVPVAPDPMPHVTKAAEAQNATSPTGAPLIVAPGAGVSPAAPLALPSTGRRGRK